MFTNHSILSKSQHGSTLVIAVLTLTILSMIGASILLTVTTRYNYSQKAIGWQGALFAAEAGANYGFANCRQMVVSGSTPAWTVSGTTAYWTVYSGTNQLSVTGTQSSTTTTSAVAVSLLTTGTANNNGTPLTSGTLIYTAPVTALQETGTTGGGTEGTNDMWYHVEVDAPSSLRSGGNQWYRIRATGYALLPGLARANNDQRDSRQTHNDRLRKLDLLFDHFIARYGDYAHAPGTRVAVSNPQAARRIEIIARPRTPFVGLQLTGTGTTPYTSPILDSWNSLASGTMGGAYDSAKNTHNAKLYLNGPAINTGGGVVDGSVYTNGGSVTHSNSNITGSIDNSTVTQTDPVATPTWATNNGGNPPASTPAGNPPLTYSYNSISSSYPLTITGASGQEADVYIYGDVLSQGTKVVINVPAGVTLKLWFTGNWNTKTNNVINGSNNAANLQIYGLATTTITPTFQLDPGGTSTLYASIYAPAYAYSTVGNSDLYGSFSFKTLSGNGNTSWHYDDALATKGVVFDFTKASWVEDPR